VRRHLGVRRIVAEGPQEEVRHPQHGATIPVDPSARPDGLRSGYTPVS
jgi:hypothetical protein